MLFGGLVTLRTTVAYDWKKILEPIAKKVTAVPLEGHTYYKIAVSDFKTPMFFGILGGRGSHEGKSVCFFQPDPRTLAVGTEQQFKAMIRHGPAATPAWAVAAGWKRVERGVFAAAINNQDQRFGKLWLMAPPEEVPAEVSAAVAKTTTVVFGIDHASDLRADLFMGCASEKDAAAMANALLHWITDGQTAIHDALDQPDKKADPWLHWAEKFLQQTGVGFERTAGENSPAVVHAQGHDQISLGELFDLLSRVKLEAEAVEVKEK